MSQGVDQFDKFWFNSFKNMLKVYFLLLQAIVYWPFNEGPLLGHGHLLEWIRYNLNGSHTQYFQSYIGHPT